MKKNSSLDELKKGKSHIKRKIFYILICVLIIALCSFLLNLWALNRIEIDSSVSSIKNSFSNAHGSASIEKETISLPIKFRNPTLIPVIGTHINAQFFYGESSLAQGECGSFFIMPYSDKEVLCFVTINNTDVLAGFINQISDILMGNKLQFSVRLDYSLWLVKIKSVKKI